MPQEQIIVCTILATAMIIGLVLKDHMCDE